MEYLSYRRKKCELTAPFWMGRSYKSIFSENITDRPIFGRINQNSAVKINKLTIQKSKIIKNSFFRKIDPNSVSWSILVQEHPITPKVLISGGKNSSHEELIQCQFFEKLIFFLCFSNFTYRVKLLLKELNVRTTTWKFFQQILWTV